MVNGDINSKKNITGGHHLVKMVDRTWFTLGFILTVCHGKSPIVMGKGPILSTLDFPQVIEKFAIENGHLQCIYPLAN